MAGKKGGASMASNKEQIVQEEKSQTNEVEIKARIDKLFTDESRPLRAFASANIGDYAIHGIKVLENDKGLWVSMPQTSYKDADGNTKYEDLFHATTADAKSRLGKAVVEEYNQALEQSQKEDAEQSVAPEETAAHVQKM
jgi:stage V sporulation protein G